MTTPRIGIAGIATESSTFSPHRTDLDSFRVTRDEALLGRYDFLTEGAPLRGRVQWVPLLHAVALPGGPVLNETYEHLRDEIVARLRDAGHLDGLFLDIHGAMSIVNRTDVETDLVRAVREVLGDQPLISASMDLHGNVSRALASQLDLVTCYRMAPHEDAWETRERAATNLVDRLTKGGRPLKAWVQVPVLLPGEKTSTRIEPAAGIYQQVREAAAREGVLDAAVWVGYAWADEPRDQAAVVVTGDNAVVIQDQAQQLAKSYWQARHDFRFVAPAGPLEWCLKQALASHKRPYFISDSGDNPTAGGAGDVSWTLARLLEQQELTSGEHLSIYASIFDADAVAACFVAGQGGAVELHIGAHVDATHEGPAHMLGHVFTLTEGDPQAGRIAVVATGGLHMIITERRKPYHLRTDFTALGLDPAEADLVVVKIGYLEPELFNMAAAWSMALTPGGVDQDLLRLGHTWLSRPMYPFDPDMADPQLVPELL